MRLTAFTDFSLRVLLVLASRTEGLVTVADIPQAFEISHAHLVKVAHVLGKTGWVETVRGRKGGMRLAVDPTQLRLGQVIRQLEEDFTVVECAGENNRCVLTGGFGLEIALKQAMHSFFSELDRHSLWDLVGASPRLSALSLWQPITVAIAPYAIDAARRGSAQTRWRRGSLSRGAPLLGCSGVAHASPVLSASSRSAGIQSVRDGDNVLDATRRIDPGPRGPIHWLAGRADHQWANAFRAERHQRLVPVLAHRRQLDRDSCPRATALG